ncbi:DUF6194 family protein [Saccharomonospora piscinae]|uniref:DUF6194 family protein n=1 Tax=Saccharomonospora piscinae TaxID=687388 RepID=UPI000465C9D0|nr:DUF6194 family protein [Saccharomonospora piscinae]
MNLNTVARHLVNTFDATTTVEHEGDTFFYYAPDGRPDIARTMPFATIITGDDTDTVSRLDSPGAFRLNIGLTKATYVSLLGPAPTRRDDRGVLDTGVDYAARDVLLPHPFYASQYWVCVVEPSEATLRRVHDLLVEAHGFAVRRHENRAARASG